MLTKMRALSYPYSMAPSTIDGRFYYMDETVEEREARNKAVEGVLREIYAAMADCIPPDKLDHRDHRTLGRPLPKIRG
jgi:hypothetical protein